MTEKDVTKRSGYVLRLLTVAALTAAFLFTALVLLDNDELTKIVPHTPFRSAAILFGYVVGLMSFNYFAAFRARNFMGWKVEATTILIFVVIFASFYSVYAFPTEHEISSGVFFGLLERSEYQNNPNWYFLAGLLAAIPLCGYVYNSLRSMELWSDPVEGDMAPKRESEVG